MSGFCALLRISTSVSHVTRSKLNLPLLLHFILSSIRAHPEIPARRYKKKKKIITQLQSRAVASFVKKHIFVGDDTDSRQRQIPPSPPDPGWTALVRTKAKSAAVAPRRRRCDFKIFRQISADTAHALRNGVMLFCGCLLVGRSIGLWHVGENFSA